MPIISNLKETRDILSRWLNKASPLYVVFSDSNISLMSFCSISSISDDVLTLSLPGGEISTQFAVARFAYSEPREAPTRIRETSMEKFVSSLEIRFPEAVCLLYELWSEGNFRSDAGAT